MRNLKDELEEVVDKHVKSPPKISEDFSQIILDCSEYFGSSQQALAICLMALGNSIKHSAHMTRKYDDELSFTELTSDAIIKMISPFAFKIMSIKRFE